MVEGEEELSIISMEVTV